MRTYDNGCFYTVTCSKSDVEAFAKRWPCFGPRRKLAFQFDKRNGDLVDLTGNDRGMDEAGVAALSSDAQAYGKRRLGLV